MILLYLSIRRPNIKPAKEFPQNIDVIKTPISRAWYVSPGQNNDDKGTIRIKIPPKASEKTPAKKNNAQKDRKRRIFDLLGVRSAIVIKFSS